MRNTNDFTYLKIFIITAFSFVLIFSSASWAGAAAQANKNSGTHFRDLFGIVPGGNGTINDKFGLPKSALSAQRPSLTWSSVQLHKNQGYRTKYVERWIEKHITSSQRQRCNRWRGIFW